jgi:hypothetical protein
VGVTAAHVSSTAATYAPTVTYTAAGAFIPSTALIYAPSTGLTVAIASIASTGVLYPPATTYGQIIFGVHIATSLIVYPPSLLRVGYLVADLSILPAVAGDLSIPPAVGGELDIEPAVAGRTVVLKGTH